MKYAQLNECMRMTENSGNLKTWFETFFDEKGIDSDRTFEINAADGTPNFIPAGVVIEHILIAPRHEQEQIKNILVAIDFKNGDVYHFLKHLATALVNSRNSDI